jgi:probable HAF family extracellular repeat protein
VNGQYSTIDDPNAGTAPGQGTAAYGVKNQGQIVGTYTDANGLNHGFVLSHGQFSTLDDPNAGFLGTIAAGINDRGQVVGNYLDDSFVIHGWVATPGGSDALAGVPSESTGASLVSAISSSGANSAYSANSSLGRISISVTVPLQSAMDPGVTLNGVRVPGVVLVFGSRTY